MKKKILITTGGTGGHIFPMLGLHDYLISNNYEVFFVSDLRAKKYLNNQILSKTKILNVNSPFNVKGIFKVFTIGNLLYSIIVSFFFLIKNRPHLVIGSGGYASFPILVASILLNVKYVLYETNSIIGKTNKFFYFFCKKLLLGYDNKEFLSEKYRSKSFYVGQILRSSFLNKNYTKINNDQKTILIMGGSQGSEFFNKVIPKIFNEIKDINLSFKIYHQCRENDLNTTKDMYNSQHEVEVFNFKNNIEEIMKKSDLAITRSGSSSIAEMINLHLPFIAIPLPNSLDNHQFYNAKYYSDKNCCWLIRQQDFSFESFKKLIIDIFSSSKKELNNKIFSIKQIKEINPIKNFEKEILEYLE